MKFYLGEKKYRQRANRHETPAGEACFILLKDNWNDYDTISSFYLEMKDEQGAIHDVGLLKILQKDELNTKLDDSFDELNSEYISLGQYVDYYTKLLELSNYDIAVSALESLRDISWSPALSDPFETASPFRNSLLRENSTDEARLHGRKIINGEEIPTTFSFDYAGRIPGADGATDIRVDFDPNDPVPGRIVGVIGRNAVGKTQYLAQLATDLAHTRRISQDALKERIEKFGGSRPAYNRIMTVSFSVFDHFPRPPKKHTNYIYCGIRNKKGRFSKNHLVQTYRDNLQRVKKHGREYEWVEYMLEILGGDRGSLNEMLEREIQADMGDLQDDELSVLSSGQAILVNFITSILAWVDTKTLIIFDEPETHLHPNAVASLFQVFTKVLKKFDSFALLATHSPLVIQELPSKRVIVFERTDNVTEAKVLAGETFGENLSDLTRHIFDTYEIPSYYKRVLSKLSRNRSYEEVLACFPKGLSLNACSYLLGCYPEDENNYT